MTSPADDQSSAVTNEQVDRLVQASERQSAASENLTLAMVEQQERARLAKRRFRVQVVLIIGGFVGLYVRQEYTLSASQDTRDQIVDCVVPTGQCYQDGQARTATFLQQLEQESLLRAACQPNYVDVDPVKRRIAAIDACIQRNLH